MEVDKVDNLILDNLLESLAMPEHPSVNAHQEINHQINGVEIGHNYQLQTKEYQENIQDESLYEIQNFVYTAIRGRNSFLNFHQISTFS